jgi:transposase
LTSRINSTRITAIAVSVRNSLRTNRQKEVFMPLQFEPGEEAQVDWHEGWVFDNGAERKYQFFSMKLSYSKATFVYPYERANLEPFLDGHVRAFEYFGGVPRRIAYDNLKCAAIKVSKGKHRRLNKRFKELRAWYLFDTRFCNIAKGNEKRDVENCCKRSERTYLSPQPHVDGLGVCRRTFSQDEYSCHCSVTVL